MEKKYAARAAVSLAYADMMTALGQAIAARNSAETLEAKALAADQVVEL